MDWSIFESCGSVEILSSLNVWRNSDNTKPISKLRFARMSQIAPLLLQQIFGVMTVSVVTILTSRCCKPMVHHVLIEFLNALILVGLIPIGFCSTLYWGANISKKDPNPRSTSRLKSNKSLLNSLFRWVTHRSLQTRALTSKHLWRMKFVCLASLIGVLQC